MVKLTAKFSFMEEWKEYKLEELSKDKGTYGIAASAVPYDPNKFTYLRITDINDDGTLNHEGLMSVDDPNASDYLLRKNDLVFARTGNSTGRTYFYQGTECPLVYAGFLIKFSIDEDKVNPRILKYYTHSQPYYDWVKSFDTGGTRGNINAKTYGNMLVRLPSSRKVQDRIVEILSSFDSKIELNRRINDNLEQQAQALFKSWFVDFEPFKDGEFVDSELGMIPKGWRVVCLGEVTKQVTEKVGNREDVTVLSPVNSGELVLSEEYFTKQVFSKNLSKYLIVNPLSFAYNPARINIGSIGLNEYDFVGCVSPVYVVFKCEPNYHYFFDFYKRTAVFKDEVALRAIGGVRQSLGYDDFSLIKTIYPTPDVVAEFNNLYLKMKEVITRNDIQNNKLTTLRDSLLPKLMSGELKINNFNR